MRLTKLVKFNHTGTFFRALRVVVLSVYSLLLSGHISSQLQLEVKIHKGPNSDMLKLDGPSSILTLGLGVFNHEKSSK